MNGIFVFEVLYYYNTIMQFRNRLRGMNHSNAGLTLLKDQLYDIFQQILYVKKFEHQIIFNALQVTGSIRNFLVTKEQKKLRDSFEFACFTNFIDTFFEMKNFMWSFHMVSWTIQMNKQQPFGAKLLQERKHYETCQG